MTPQQQAAAVRAAAGLFSPGERGLVEVSGADRVRWLDGMLSADVAALSEGPERSGCYALLLTRQGRIVADLHVLLRPGLLWLELAAAAAPRAVAQLERFIVADDVRLAIASNRFARLALEGPASEAVLAAARGAALRLAPHACEAIELEGAPLVVAAFGSSGLPALQLFAPLDAADRLRGRLLAAGASLGLVAADRAALELLRLEAGVPAFGAELGEDVLPAEARLERAISTSKGCYTGQEVVERMRSRGQVGHLLVGLRCGDPPPAPGTAILHGGKEVGSVTSSGVSPAAGPIALAFVRRAQAQPGTELAAAGRPARVVELPFVPA